MFFIFSVLTFCPLGPCWPSKDWFFQDSQFLEIENDFLASLPFQCRPTNPKPIIYPPSLSALTLRSWSPCHSHPRVRHQTVIDSSHPPLSTLKLFQLASLDPAHPASLGASQGNHQQILAHSSSSPSASGLSLVISCVYLHGVHCRLFLRGLWG